MSTPFEFPVDPMELSLIIKKVRNCGNYAVETFMVHPINNKGKILRRGPDDETYIKFPNLRKLVPRGCSDLYYHGKFIYALRGPEKFDGTSAIDEDDMPFDGATEEDVSENKSMLPIGKINNWHADGVLEVETQVKANGKFAIFTILDIEGKLYLFGGSKNIHVLHPLNKFIIEDGLHWNILNEIQHAVNTLPADVIISQLLNKTIIGEYVDGQHLVYTRKPYMVFFNCPTLGANKEVFPKQNKPLNAEQLTDIRQMIGIEGVVIYYRNTVTNEVFLQKHKTKWYILWRAIREKMMHKNRTDSSLCDIVKLLQSRVRTLSDSYIKLNDEELTQWNTTIVNFIAWFQTTTYAYSDVGPFTQVGMARILNEFYATSVDDLSKSAALVKLDSDSEDDEEHTPFNENKQESTNQPHRKTFLHCPEQYDMVIATAEAGFRVAVIMAGPSGSGKSSVAHALARDLSERKITSSIHSTDTKFMVGGQYRFDPKKLGIYHKQNLADFSSSDAQVRICDNTNLKRGDLNSYIFAATGDQVFILSMSNASPKELLLRNKHGLGLDALTAMVSKYQPYAPSYYGIFPKKADVLAIVPQGTPVDQKTPLHITCLFVGGSAKLDIPPDGAQLGTFVKFEAIGVSEHDAGWALVTHSTLPGDHITLTTKPNHKPVDVGTGINASNTTLFDSPKTLVGLYLPFY